MLAKIIIFVFITIHCLTLASAPNPVKESETSPSGTIRVFYPITNDIKTETSYLYEEQNDRQLHEFSFKIEENLDNNISYGLTNFLRFGERNENDWKLVSGQWNWDDENSAEVSSAVFLSKKFIFKNIYHLDVMGEGIRNWSENFFTISPEIKLSYFISSHNIFLKYKPYFPLNFSKEDIYKESVSLGFLYNASSRYKPSVFIKHTSLTWSESESFSGRFPDTSYAFKSEIISIGFGLNIYF